MSPITSHYLSIDTPKKLHVFVCAMSVRVCVCTTTYMYMYMYNV